MPSYEPTGGFGKAVAFFHNGYLPTTRRRAEGQPLRRPVVLRSTVFGDHIVPPVLQYLRIRRVGREVPVFVDRRVLGHLRKLKGLGFRLTICITS